MLSASTLRGRVHQFSLCMHEFFPTNELVYFCLLLTINLLRKKIFLGQLCASWDYHIFMDFRDIFYVSITRGLPGAACTPALQSFHYWQTNDVSILLSDVPPGASI